MTRGTFYLYSSISLSALCHQITHLFLVWPTHKIKVQNRVNQWQEWTLKRTPASRNKSSSNNKWWYLCSTHLIQFMQINLILLTPFILIIQIIVILGTRGKIIKLKWPTWWTIIQTLSFHKYKRQTRLLTMRSSRLMVEGLSILLQRPTR